MKRILTLCSLLCSGSLSAASFTHETDVEFTASGDFNGDGQSDFILVDKALGLYRIGYGSAAGTYSQAAALATGLETVDALSVGRISNTSSAPTADRFAVVSIAGNRAHLLPGNSPSFNAPTALHLLGAGPDSIAIVDIPGAGDTVHEDIFGTCRYETSGLPVKLRQLRHTGLATTQLTTADLGSAHRSANAVQVIATGGLTHVALIGGIGFTENLRLYRPDASGAVFLDNVSLPGTGNRYTHACFGSASTATFIVYRSGSADVQAHVISDLGGGSYQFGAAVTSTLPAPVKALYTVQELGGAPRLLALHTDGSAAWYQCTAGSISLLSTINLSAESGTPSGIIPLGNGKYQMLFSADGSGRSSRFISMTHDGAAWSKANGGNLAVAADYAAFANVVFLSQRPFLDDAPAVLASMRAGDWTTSATVMSGPPSTATATGERFDSSAAGLGNPSATSLGSVPAGTAGTLTNQVLSNFSYTSLTPAQGEIVDNVTIDPPGGSYTSSVQFTLTSSGGNSIYFRKGNLGAFSSYVVPQRIYSDDSVQFYSVSATGERSAIQTATYDLTQEAADQDSDGDGVPDFVEVAKGLDPAAGQDSDRDGIGDLTELVEGTNPGDKHSKPEHADLNGTNAKLNLAVTPTPFNGDKGLTTLADTGTQVQAHSLAGAILAAAETAPSVASVSASPIDATHRLAVISTPARYNLVDGVDRPRTAVESVGLVPLPGASAPSISFTFDSHSSTSSQVTAWTTAAQAAFASPAATAVTLDHFDTLALVLMERRLTTLLRARALLTDTQFANLTPFRMELDDNHRFIDDSDIEDLERGSDAGDASLRFQETLAAIESGIANTSDADVVALRAFVVELHRIASALNSGDTAVGLPLDVLRSFVNSSPHALPSSGINSGFSTHLSGGISLAQAGTAIDSILASLGNRSTTSMDVTVDLTLDDTTPDTLVRDQATPSTTYRLLDANGDAFDLPDTFDLTTGAILTLSGYNDLGSTDGHTNIQVLNVTLKSLPAVTLADTDGDLLPDEWERLFFGSMTATASTAQDGSGYAAFQEYLAGTDPSDSTSTPVDAKADFSMRRVTITPVGGNLDLRWNWPNAYLSPVAFTIFESSDLVNWTPRATTHSTVAADTQCSLFTKPSGARKFYMVGVRLK